MNLQAWGTALTIVSMIVGLAVAVAVLFTLAQTAIALGRVRRTAEQLAGGLEAAAANTASLPDHIPAISGALTAIEGGLESVDIHLVGTARAYGVVR